jgi:hypothetical protein
MLPSTSKRLFMYIFNRFRVISEIRYKQGSMKCCMTAADGEETVTDIKLYIKQDIILTF